MQTLIEKRHQGLGKIHWMLGGSVLLLFLALLGYFAIVRPVIVVVPGLPDIYVKNTGKTNALIYRVDGFWYWGGKVSLLGNLPAIRHLVEPGTGPVRLQIPHIPGPGGEIAHEGPWYMKLIVRYGIPGIPVFRYTTTLYFEFDLARKTWTSVDAIPPKYRALGNVGMGNVGKIELDFRLKR